MDGDDRTIGHVFSRREMVTLLGAAGYFTLAHQFALAAQTPAVGSTGCVVRPEQTEGPYFVDAMLDRSDIRTDPTDGTVSAGIPLELTLVIGRLAGNACAPIAGAQVDLWQCDHVGIYSGVQDQNFDTRGKKFLRGFQRTDEQGRARFTTIYPGWYPGRTVHIHFKVRSAPDRRPGWTFTSQLYFDDELTDRVFALRPYAERGPRSTRNDGDGIFRRGGDQLMLAAAPKERGYAARFQIALQDV